MLTSWTGIVCVILVTEGRASNYLFGAVHTAIYLLLSFKATFYGEMLTSAYFFIMQPIGLYNWLSNRINGQAHRKQTRFEARTLSAVDWFKYLALTSFIWISVGFAYQGVGSHRPFRDSMTDATNVVGQILMTNLYREQWIFWIATNIFSIYLWWQNNEHIQIMYWVYALNSAFGWYRWTAALKPSAEKEG